LLLAIENIQIKKILGFGRISFNDDTIVLVEGEFQ